MLTHRNLLAMVCAYLADVRAASPSDRIVHAAPLTHGGGLYALPALARGATQAITTSRSFEPEELLRTVERLRATDIAFLTPTMLRWTVEAQAQARADLGSLENVVYGGAPMYRDDLVATLEALGPRLSQIYGQAEAPVTIARLTRDEHARGLVDEPGWLTSAGRAYTTVEVAVATAAGPAASGEGEILARGDVVMPGYWRNEAASAEALRDGWLHTGDLGAIDERGYLHLLDRSKDVIISGGANIYPREIEELLLEHPAVRQVAVVGAPDEQWGERVVAVLALHQGARREDVQAALDVLCRTRLAGYKRPRDYDWRDELPTSSYGKVLKRELRDAYWISKERRI
jgi:acyl-CoA synthetase (AMP-forming)/AMP-acid ligase II